MGKIKNKLKKHKEVLFSKTIFRRLLVSFVLVILPIYILSAVIYNWAITTLRDEISGSVKEQVSFYVDSMESEMRRIRVQQYNCIGDINLQKLSAIPHALDNIERMQNIRNLQVRINAIKNSSDYISNVFVMIPELDRTVNTSNISVFDKDMFDKMNYNLVELKERFIEIDDKLFLTVAYPYQGLIRKKEPSYIIAVEISKSVLEKQLLFLQSNSDENSLLVSYDLNLILSSSNDKEINSAMYSLIDETLTGNGVRTVIIEDKPYLVAYEVSDYLGMILCKYIPEDTVFAELHKFRSWFLILIFSAFAIILIYSAFTYKIIHKPLFRLTSSFKEIEKGNLSVNIKHPADDEFRYIYERFNIMAERLDNLIEQSYKQKILMQESELKQLQSQINPHFLYNSFFIMNTMVRTGDIENLEEFTEQLGKYFQFITRNASADIPLYEEVEHARIYTDIQAMRFSKRIKVKFDCLPEKYKDFLVPRLILQPIIENSFEYGLEAVASNGILRITFIEEAQGLLIVVEDNGAITDGKLEALKGQLLEGVNEGSGKEITGIINIHQRIRLKYGNESGILLSRSDLGGLKTVICFMLTEAVSPR